MKHQNIILLLALVLLILGYTIKKLMDSPLSESSYIAITYFYVAIAIIITTISYLFQSNMGFELTTVFEYIMVFVLSIGSLIWLLLTPSENIITKNVLWLIFIIFMSIISKIIYNDADNKNILLPSLLTLIIIAVGLSVAAFLIPKNSLESWNNYLYAGLTALIIFELIDLFFGKGDFASREKMYGMIGVALFSGYLLYDTNKLRQNASDILKSCSNSNQYLCTDYPSQSLTIFLDLINLLNNVLRLQK
jgi:FtsH-binding integral membrane protein